MANRKFDFLRTWVVPEGFQVAVRAMALRARARYFLHRSLFKSNLRFRNVHIGKRCFILANGPSVKSQDIRPLKSEHVFSVSNGYHHADYDFISPAYHCLPQLTYHTKFTEEIAVTWFREMDSRLGKASLFLSHQEYGLVKRHGLFQGRDVSFLCLGTHFDEGGGIPDITNVIPSVSTVPILAVQLAMYMGFKEIYLLGTDHDWFVKKEYKYFYEPTVLKGTDFGTTANGRIENTLYQELPNIIAVWSQYHALQCIAERSSVRIFNATEGGMLDEFPLVRFDTLFSRENGNGGRLP